MVVCLELFLLVIPLSLDDLENAGWNSDSFFGVFLGDAGCSFLLFLGHAQGRLVDGSLGFFQELEFAVFRNLSVSVVIIILHFFLDLFDELPTGHALVQVLFQRAFLLHFGLFERILYFYVDSLSWMTSNFPGLRVHGLVFKTGIVIFCMLFRSISLVRAHHIVIFANYSSLNSRFGHLLRIYFLVVLRLQGRF